MNSNDASPTTYTASGQDPLVPHQARPGEWRVAAARASVDVVTAGPRA